MINLISLEAERYRYEEMLKVAEHERLVRQMLAVQPSRMAQLRRQFGAMLNKLGQQLHKGFTTSASGHVQSKM